MPTARRITNTRRTLILNTLPKSGSVFLKDWLSVVLNKPFMRIAANEPGGFISDDIAPEKLAALKEIAGITQQHFDPSLRNLKLVSNCRVVVHVRDPRQSLLSWVHHVDETDKQLPIEKRHHGEGWTLENKIDWQIDRHFRYCIAWIDSWLNVPEELRPCMMWTTYEEFRTDKVAFMNKLCGFYGVVPVMDVQECMPCASPDTHFRRGLVDEWRDVFTPYQQEVVTALMPERFFTLFDWSK